ncbi:MAG: hypothetical protein LBI45_08385 [Bacteroidales bacterium]|jgi:5-hydroxyisourate hydrolase-like protein (transthyretin family)|nr:hypothetical protein [Bacteroidales bacterium]
MTKIFKITLFIITFFLSMNLFAQNKATSPEVYDNLWKQVEKFNNNALPKSALAIADEIYNLALSENNEKQMIKSIVHQMGYVKNSVEEGMKNAITKLENEIPNYSGIVKPFMHLFLAVMYQEYFNVNSYLINQQSVTYNFENKDIATWDKTKFQSIIIKNYLLALDKNLKKENITEYSDFIRETKESASCFPTLYDFIAYYIINKVGETVYYRFDNQNNNDKFRNNDYLSDLETFVKLQLASEPLSYKYTALKVFQQWLKFRMENENNNEALIHADLIRLNFVKNNLTTVNKDKIWEKSLLYLQKKYYSTPEFVQINWELAKQYNQWGDSYNFQDSATHIYKTNKGKAIELLNDAMTRFPNAKYYAACHDLKADIEEVVLSFEIEKVVNANEKIPLRITYKNTDNFSLKIYMCDYEKFVNLREEQYSEINFPELIKISKDITHIKSKELLGSEDYNTHYTEYLAESLPFGFYVIVLETKENIKVYQTLFSSELCIVAKGTHNDNSDLYIINRKTGQPIENAKVELYKQEYDSKQRKNIYKKETTLHSDKLGFVKVNIGKKERWSNYYRVDVSYKNDFISENSSFYSYATTNSENKSFGIHLFTDRAIYRPGQIVHIKGICTKKEGLTVSIEPNLNVEVDIIDANWQKISTINLVSNEFGTISGSFSIPPGILTGDITIRTNNGSCNINVEEYKRPMFEVQMLPLEGEYRLNDTICVEGKVATYAGTPLTDAKVTYSVVRNPLWRPWWGEGRKEKGGWIMPNLGIPMEIAFGEVALDNEGKLKVNFKALVDEIALLQNYVAYNYTLYITVTDINGETQTGTTSVLVANRALELSSSIKSEIIREKIDSISIKSQNIAGIFTPANVEIEVLKLKDTEYLLLKKQWGIIDQPLYSEEEWYKQYPGHEYNNETDFSNYKIEKMVYQRKINTANTKTIKLDGAEKWSTGVYRMVLKSVDKWGIKVENVKEFVLFSEKEKKLPYKETNFFYMDKTSAQPGELVNLFVGSSFKDVLVYFDLEAQGKTVTSEIIKLNAEIRKIAIPIEESYRGNLSVNLLFVKNGRVFSYTETIKIDWNNKKLDIKFITYRDKTLPGATENWQLKITDYLSKPAEAELMASLYDASLDIFAKNRWSLNPFPTYYSKLSWSSFGFNTLTSNSVFNNYNRELLFKGFPNPCLNLFDYYASYGGPRYYIDGVRTYPPFSQDNTTSNQKLNSAKGSDVTENSLIEDYDSSEDIGGIQKSQVRCNFSETAFFYPNLTTNDAGEVFLNFTMPESLTRWNFMGFAHSKDLKIGTINEEIITQKELMVMPNLPRFFRENDIITVCAKINNVSETDIDGTAKIEFYDVETLKSLNSLFIGTEHGKQNTENDKQNTKSFNVTQNGNTVVEWKITIPEGISAVGVRIIAEGKNHSDGEERILPILSNKMLVTESVPLPVRKAGTTQFNLSSLKNNNSTTLRHESYTLEFTANPVWYAVQALPYLMEYPYECAEQVFSRFYANSLSGHIANSDPKIMRVFELWKTIPESKTLLSNLEKNQELKALLIEETPWLLNAKNESERKRNIGMLFDLNRLANENHTAIKKLSEIQTGSGGFPWFKGMRENWYITQHIVGGFGHLNKLGVNNPTNEETVRNILQKAVQFIDKELERSYEDLKKYCKDKCLEKENLGYMQIHYLYVRSFFNEEYPIQKSTLEAFDYYKKQAEQYWTKKDVYMQGMISLALHKYGDSKTPAKIVASLKERAIHNAEMGMYWKLGNGCYWYQAPIETQALLIEVFSDIANDNTSVEEMKVWLLKQKQTQDWKTTKATTEAIYALLLQNTNLLADTDFPIIKIADNTIDVAADSEIKTEAGTGYFKKRWDGSQINSDWGSISVTKMENGVAWGAVYWQYFEQLDKIKQYEETPLTIKKQLFAERREGDKLVIVPVETWPATSLQIGDKVKVRIEIRVDRDMEYVHLKDMRAACFEPVDYLSGYRNKSGFGYYQGIKDASMNFFIDYLQKGTYVFEYDLRVSQKGEFSNGITTIQSMYAPEFTSHSEGVRVVVSD